MYLKLKDGYNLTNDFLKLFDLYIFAINIYRYKNQNYYFLENLYSNINFLNITNTEDYYLYFYVIYYQIFNYIKKYGNIKKILKDINLIGTFKIIKKILNKKFEYIHNNIDINYILSKIHKTFDNLDEINITL